VNGDGLTVCKFRVINLNYNASRLVIFDVIRETILRGTGEEPIVVNVHTEKKIEPKRKGSELNRSSPNPKIKCT